MIVKNKKEISSWEIRWGKVRPYLYVAPAIVFICIFVIYPLSNLIYMGFIKWNMVSPVKEWVGLDNYKYIFNDGEFITSLWNTTVYTFFTVGLSLSISLLVGAWIRKPSKFNNFVQGAIFLPHIISLVSISMVWMWLMDTDKGLLNYILEFFGLPKSRWFKGSESAMMSVIIVAVWKGIGYYSLIISSSIQRIPQEILEAAELDNAGRIKTFFKIILPMISPTTFMLLITMTIGAYKVFDTVNITTGGGPGSATMVIVYYVYEQAFRIFRLGPASAAGTILLIIISAVTALYFKLLSKRVHYN